jgi:hypothetical protein
VYEMLGSPTVSVHKTVYKNNILNIVEKIILVGWFEAF